MAVNCGSSAPSQRLGGAPGTGMCALRSPHAAGHRVGDEIKRTAVLVILALAICWSRLHATAQEPDRLIFRGEECALFVNPLETFFHENPEKRVKGCTSTALWRGYVAKFEIRDSILYVKDVEIMGPVVRIVDSTPLSLQSVFPAIFDSDSAVMADWFSGLLVLPGGEIIDNVHMGYATKFECYILLQISNGVLVKEREVSGDEYMEFKRRQFREYKKSPEYRAQVEELGKNGRSQEYLDSFLFI